MKRFCLILSLLFTLGTFAQDNPLQRHYLKVYSQALAYNDLNTAINALQGYIAVDNDLKYKDTLSMLYFSNKAYVSSLILAEEVYKTAPSEFNAMARAAECYDELGDPKTAVNLYEQVVPKLNSPFYTYKLAVGQYQLKRSLEAEQSANAVLLDTSSKRIGVNFVGADGRTQAVPVNAAAANLLGVLKMDVKEYAAAKVFFQRSLDLYPKFEGARQNLEYADKNLKPASKTGTKTK